MNPDLPPYKYAPLKLEDAIRVLILLPASTYSASLQVRLIHTQGLQSLGQYDEPCPTSYEAISYAWGEPVFSHHLECEGHIIKVTANVDNLLRRLRKSTHPQSLWLDSVCINQDDEEEKGFQVQMMGQIFSRARKVLVWLGEAEPRDRIEWVFNFVREAAISGLHHNKALEERSGESNLLEKDIDKTVDRFFARPWFGRRWVLQEVALALDITVRCGLFKMPWLSFARGCRTLNSSLSTQAFFSDSSEYALGAIASLSTPPDQLLDMLFEYHLSDCSDPRDRIFALYGMITGLKDIAVNYKVSWIDTYINFAGICVKRGYFLVLLQHVTAFGSLSEEESSMPSWVPKWNCARFSAKRFSCKHINLLYPIFKMPSNAPNIVSGRSTLFRVHQDFRLQEQKARIVRGRSKKSRDPPSKQQYTDGTSYMDIAKFLFHCQHPLKSRAYASSAFANALSAAVMDMYLCFDTRDAALQFMKDTFILDLSKHATSNLNPEHSGYASIFNELRMRLEDVLQVAEHTPRHESDKRLQTRLQTHKAFMQLAELLKHHNLFYLLSWDRGHIAKFCIPGITSCSIEDGDRVLPMGESQLDGITPENTAFLLRPVGNESVYRIVGLCFVAEPHDLRHLHDWESSELDDFKIM